MLSQRFMSLSLAGYGVCFCIGGCTPDAFYPTMGDVKQIADIGRQQLDVHDANITRQHATMAPDAAAAVHAERDVFARELEQLGNKMAALEASHATMLRESIALAARLTAMPDSLARNLSDALVPRIDQARNAAAAVKADVERVETRADGAAATAQRVEATARGVEAALTALAGSMTDRLAAAGEKTDTRLSALRGELTAWQQRMADEPKLSPEQIERLGGMTTEQIIALVAAALGSAGLGIAGGRTGSSRAEPRLQRLEGKVSTLAEEVKLRTPVPV